MRENFDEITLTKLIFCFAFSFSPFSVLWNRELHRFFLFLGHNSIPRKFSEYFFFFLLLLLSKRTPVHTQNLYTINTHIYTGHVHMKEAQTTSRRNRPRFLLSIPLILLIRTTFSFVFFFFSFFSNWFFLLFFYLTSFFRFCVFSIFFALFYLFEEKLKKKIVFFFLFISRSVNIFYFNDKNIGILNTYRYRRCYFYDNLHSIVRIEWKKKRNK